MMSNRTIMYMVAAITVGYLLIAQAPQQISMYTTPQLQIGDSILERLEAPADPSESFTPEPESDTTGEANPETEDIESGARLPFIIEDPELEIQRGENFLDLYKWWVVDLIIALTVYLFARQRLS